MKWQDFLNIVKNFPIIEINNLFVGDSATASLRVQITRWQNTGKVIQLRRGIYILAEEYRRVEPYEPYIASILKSPSYVSLEKALEYHNLIPESVNVFTSVTTKRPLRYNTSIGIFDYRHITHFWGYKSITVNKQTGFMALPEKALLDLIYLKKVRVTINYLAELRLQNMDKINLDRLFEFAAKINKPKIYNAAKLIKKYIENNKTTHLKT